MKNILHMIEKMSILIAFIEKGYCFCMSSGVQGNGRCSPPLLMSGSMGFEERLRAAPFFFDGVSMGSPATGSKLKECMS